MIHNIILCKSCFEFNIIYSSFSRKQIIISIMIKTFMARVLHITLMLHNNEFKQTQIYIYSMLFLCLSENEKSYLYK